MIITMATTQPGQQAQRATYLSLMGLFTTLFATFSLSQRNQQPLEITPMDLTLLSLASYRGGRLIAYDKVTEPLRSTFASTEPDDSGAGETVTPQGTGVRRAIGELIACPTCVGTWLAAGFVYGLKLAPRPTRIMLAILSANGAAELIDSSVEALTWAGRVARDETGLLQERQRGA
jgi:hypothetical protein